MSVTHPQPEPHAPAILSGPFGSLLNDRYHISTAEAFRHEQFDSIREILKEYLAAGVTQPVTPTFGAAARGVQGGIFTPELRHWNLHAARLTQEVFGGNAVLGSVAPLLDTSGHDDHLWQQEVNQVEQAQRIHRPQIEAFAESGLRRIIAEAVHDLNEARGLVRAGAAAQLSQVIVSFEPIEGRLPASERHIEQYSEVLQRLRDEVHGDIDVRIGLNCGSISHINHVLATSEPDTFAAVYPNQVVIPTGKAGDRFRELADKNHKRSPYEKCEFDSLRRTFVIQNEQLQKMIVLCREKRVGAVGLCCGASPAEIGNLAASVLQII